MVRRSLNVSTTSHLSFLMLYSTTLLLIFPAVTPPLCLLIDLYLCPCSFSFSLSLLLLSPCYLLLLSPLICYRRILDQWRILLDMRSLVHAGASQKIMNLIFHPIQSRTFCITHPQLYLQSFINLLYHHLCVVSYRSQVIFICMYRKYFSVPYFSWLGPLLIVFYDIKPHCTSH